ncbi:MAG: riboflavin biosynthesis protein RibF [Phycisphaerales bacterium]
MNGKTSLTIGTFDGVHAGHRALLHACRLHAGENGRVIALAFDPHPLTRLRPEAAPGRLTTFDRKRELLTQAGADEVVQLRPEDALLGESPTEFLRWLARTYAPSLVVEGDDFRFGKDRAGDIATIASLGPALGLHPQVVPEVDVTLSDHTVAPARSSLVRWLLTHSRVDDAARVLGRPYELSGVVARGDQLGRTIGVPTANLTEVTTMLPANGVYAAEASLPGGACWPAALNIGTRPTVAGSVRRVEAHLIEPAPGTATAGLPDYGWAITLKLHAFIRDELRFASLDALKGQVARDTSRVRSVVQRKEPAWT